MLARQRAFARAPPRFSGEHGELGAQFAWQACGEIVDVHTLLPSEQRNRSSLEV